MSERQMHRSVFLSLPWLLLVTLCLDCAFVPAVPAQTCGGQGVAVQVLGSGGPELQDKRASSSYLVWQDGQARVLVDAGGGSALRFGERGANMSQLDVILFMAFGVWRLAFGVWRLAFVSAVKWKYGYGLISRIE